MLAPFKKEDLVLFGDIDNTKNLKFISLKGSVKGKKLSLEDFISCIESSKSINKNKDNVNYLDLSFIDCEIDFSHKNETYYNVNMFSSKINIEISFDNCILKSIRSEYMFERENLISIFQNKNIISDSDIDELVIKLDGHLEIIDSSMKKLYIGNSNINRYIKLRNSNINTINNVDSFTIIEDHFGNIYSSEYHISKTIHIGDMNSNFINNFTEKYLFKIYSGWDKTDIKKYTKIPSDIDFSKIEIDINNDFVGNKNKKEPKQTLTLDILNKNIKNSINIKFNLSKELKLNFEKFIDDISTKKIIDKNRHKISFNISQSQINFICDKSITEMDISKVLFA